MAGIGPEAWKAELVRFWPQSRPVVDQIRDHSQFSFATYRHAWPKRLAQGRICRWAMPPTP